MTFEQPHNSGCFTYVGFAACGQLVWDVERKAMREAQKAPMPSYALWKVESVETSKGYESESSEDSFHVQGHFAALHSFVDSDHDMPA